MKSTDWNTARKITEGAAFNRVAAYVILNPAGEICGTVKIQFPKDGAGRVTAILHEHGSAPQIGTASGYGYDKKSAALSGGVFAGITLVDSGTDWTRQLENNGYKVYQAC